MTDRNEGLIQIATDGVTLEGNLLIPDAAIGIVVFAHGSGSSRFSSRNRYVAEELRRASLGTLLLDLLTADEERIDSRTAHLRFDIDLLARRLVGTVEWLKQWRTGAPACPDGAPASPDFPVANLKIGLFGASTGGGAALVAAARRPGDIAAVVSRGGRPDLAGAALPKVEAPTLLIVGGNDEPVIEMNETAYAQMHCERRLEIVPGATHLFEEPGTLEQVARLATAWFKTHLSV